MEALKHYKFSLAFENSNEEDYVTEKFFQSLVAGMEYVNYLPSSFLLSSTRYSTYMYHSCSGDSEILCFVYKKTLSWFLLPFGFLFCPLHKILFQQCNGQSLFGFLKV